MADQTLYLRTNGHETRVTLSQDRYAALLAHTDAHIIGHQPGTGDPIVTC